MGVRKTHAIDQVKDNAHSNAEFLKIEVSIVVDVCEVPDPLELVISQLAVFEDRRGLGAVEVSAAVGKGGEDFPVALYLFLLDFLVRHCIGGGLSCVHCLRRVSRQPDEAWASSEDDLGGVAGRRSSPLDRLTLARIGLQNHINTSR